MQTKNERLVPWLDETRAWAEAQLEAALAGVQPGPARHTEALRYALFGLGKRLRPALVRLVCEHLGGTDEQAGPAAHQGNGRDARGTWQHTCVSRPRPSLLARRIVRLARRHG